MLRDDATLVDIAEAARLIGEFAADMDKSAFDKDRKTQSAVLHQLMIIGEAVKRLTPEYKALHAEIPWSQIAGMRDFLIHAYHAVDLDEVWNTVTKDVPALLAAITPLLPQIDLP